MTEQEAIVKLGDSILDLVQAFALNQVKKQLRNETEHERRRLIARRYNSSFQIRSASRKCKILQLF